MLLYFFHFLPNNNSHTEKHGGWCQNLHFFFFSRKNFIQLGLKKRLCMAQANHSKWEK